MKLEQACLTARNDRESSFHHCGGLGAREGQLSDKIARESSFHHCAGPVKPVPACFSGRNDRERSFLHCGGIVKLVQAC